MDCDDELGFSFLSDVERRDRVSEPDEKSDWHDVEFDDDVNINNSG